MAPAIVSKIFSAALQARAPDDIGAVGPIAARSVLLARNPSQVYENDPSAGIIPPQKINNNAVFAIFGLIGAAFVLVGIWFFFWAKNGGFYFKDNDWEEYVSTVLRRKGPNGTIYSNATPSTVLDGGSIYKEVDDGVTMTADDNTTVISGTTGITGITGGVSDISGRERRRKKREQKEREKERRREEKAREKEKRSHRRVSGGVVVDPEAEAEAEEQLRRYRDEKPACVGGINTESDASTWDASTNPTWSTVSGSHARGDSISSIGDGEGSTVTSELISNRQRSPTNSPTKTEGNRGGRIRKVYSTADKTAMRENQRIRAEARRLQEKGRQEAAAAALSNMSSSSKEITPLRRDFSFVRGAEDRMALRRIDEAIHEESVPTGSMVSGYITAGDNSSVADGGAAARRASRTRSRSQHRASESKAPGGWTESEISASSAATDDTGTKVYQHPHHVPTLSEISGTSVSDFAYAEEKRKKRGGAGARRHQ